MKRGSRKGRGDGIDLERPKEGSLFGLPRPDQGWGSYHELPFRNPGLDQVRPSGVPDKKSAGGEV
jgi:hypothetical protein